MNNKQVIRMNKVNDLINVIANTDRKFFNFTHRENKLISRFVELKTTVKFLDGYTLKAVTINNKNKDCNFSHCGTMWGLVKDFKEWIITGKESDAKNGYGGLYCTHWGYSEEGMKAIRRKATE